MAAGLPEAIAADQTRLAELDRQIDNLVGQLAGGAGESPAIRRALDRLEREAEELRARVDEAIRARGSAIEMPDDDWIRAQMADLPALLVDEPRRAAPLLRRLLVRIEAEGVVAPGKVRGFARLHLRVDPAHLIEESLGGRLAAAAPGRAAPSPAGAREFAVDLGGPTRRDALAPQIAEMRARGVTWPEIGRVTGLGTGNAYNVWKRWCDARPEDRHGVA